MLPADRVLDLLTLILLRFKLLQADANLANVSWWLGDVAEFAGGFDIGLATHLCGELTDVAMEKCIGVGAAFVLTPCCLGKIKHVLPGEAKPKASTPRCSKIQCVQPQPPYASMEEQHHARIVPPRPIPSSRRPPPEFTCDLVRWVRVVRYPRSRWLRGEITEASYVQLLRLSDHNAQGASRRAGAVVIGHSGPRLPPLHQRGGVCLRL